MAKKSFFQEIEIRNLKFSRAYTQKNLIEKIDNLANDEALEIRTQIIPGKFFINSENGAQAARKCLKHGDLIAISHPKTIRECYNSCETPSTLMAADFEKIRKMKEHEINFIGYSVRPNWGDRTKRVTHFYALPEGARLFSYAEQKAGGIIVEIYKDAKIVAREGASAVVQVPSRTEKMPRYVYRLEHVPIVKSPWNLAIVLGLKPKIEIDEKSEEVIRGRPTHETYLIRYNWENDLRKSSIITYYPHDVAAYLGIIKREHAEKNTTPLEMNPFALPSKHQARFYTRLNNNVMIYDPTLKSKKNKDKLRKLNLAEKCILLSRAIGKFGHDDFSFWDPNRDGKIRDYNWSAEQ